MKNRLPLLFSVLMIFVMVLAACAPGVDDGDNFGPTPDLENPGLTDPTGVVEPTAVVEPTVVVEPTTVVETPAPVDPTAEATQPVGAVDMDNDLNRLSELLNEDLYTAAAATATELTDEHRVGELDSVLVDSTTGEIVFGVVQVHEAFELDTEFVAIPWSEMDVRNEVAATGAGSVAMDDVRVTVNVDREVMMRHPELTSDLLESDTTAWQTDLYSFWSNEIATLPQTGMGTEGQLIRVNSVSDFDVDNTEGEELGDVVEMILGPAPMGTDQAATTEGANNHIRYVVIGIGGFLGLGEELVAVPFDRLQVRAEADDNYQNTFVLNLDRETLEQAPRFRSIDEFPSTRAPGWDIDLDTFWRNIGS